MKNIIVFCLAAFVSQAAFAQSTTPAPAPEAEKKACCVAGSEKSGKSCSTAGAEKSGKSCATDASAAADTKAAAAPADQPGRMVKKVAVTTPTTQTAQFQVWGNCGMCKKTIEKAAQKTVGVEKAEWNVETHQFVVTFDPAKTSVEKVHQAIAAAGYDTDQVKGDDTAYNKLHACCHYERKK